MKFLIVCAALLGLAAAVPNAHFKNAVRDSDACNGVQCEGTTPSTGTHPPSRPPTKARSDEAAMEKRVNHSLQYADRAALMAGIRWLAHLVVVEDVELHCEVVSYPASTQRLSTPIYAK
ncbi:predicted protein [Pyrenophora tritici-repentis Pt-1C-BFP]|uniref:Uncharacterized protein n=1 Tax=Pyrenophora tritici-repentis (strain Pt-1C-BFP) TaxID=426418 RepID=B2W8A4_PYRTR|nr:uncharacterized protein PTRG_06042 [Pyrenophora tritici-repentis Pt-1C-BFP]EDU48962.1 predicted protein [Pyrenophora tritici-repentis Pt-1C-BFP]